MNDERLRLGIDVGGTNLRMGVFSDLRMIAERREALRLGEACARARTDDAAAQLVVDALGDAIAASLQEHPGIAAIGIGFPGFIHPHSGLLLQSPNLPHLHDVDIAAPLRERFGVPIALENDANAAAYGEYLLAREREPGLRHFLYLGLGTGVGGGLVLRGRPHRGSHGVAMEIGHLIVEPGGRRCGCGNQGCLEQYASATGVQRSYTEQTGHAPDVKVIAQLAGEGHQAAKAAFDRAGQTLGQALAHILKVVDVSQVCIGGGMSAAWDCFYPTLRERLEADLIPALRGQVHIHPSTSKDQAGMLGAARLADEDG